MCDRCCAWTLLGSQDDISGIGSIWLKKFGLQWKKKLIFLWIRIFRNLTLRIVETALPLALPTFHIKKESSSANLSEVDRGIYFRPWGINLFSGWIWPHLHPNLKSVLTCTARYSWCTCRAIWGRKAIKILNENKDLWQNQLTNKEQLWLG